LKHQELGLTDEQVREMYRYMLLARKVDEKMWLLNRAGKLPFVVSCQGQEATQIGAAYALDREKDWLCPYYRDLGMVLLFGQTARDQMLSAFAKKEDPNSGGRQMPNHFGDHRYRILSGSSPVTTQMLHAVGIAYAGKITGEDHVVLTSCGEGSSNQGDWHEALNFAGVHKLPVVFLVENNLYAISVPLSKQLAGENVAARGQGYGMPGIRVDGNDVFQVYETMKVAVERARKGEGPTLIEAVSYRLTPHSSDDDDLTYRTKEEVEKARKQDGLFVLETYLDEHQLWTTDEKEALSKELDTEITEAIKFAEAADHPDPEDLSKHVFAR
jgi:2-oxoisovalerate dehydrogenase E1 component alpha subunit